MLQPAHLQAKPSIALDPLPALLFPCLVNTNCNHRTPSCLLHSRLTNRLGNPISHLHLLPDPVCVNAYMPVEPAISATVTACREASLGSEHAADYLLFCSSTALSVLPCPRQTFQAGNTDMSPCKDSMNMFIPYEGKGLKTYHSKKASRSSRGAIGTPGKLHERASSSETCQHCPARNNPSFNYVLS